MGFRAVMLAAMSVFLFFSAASAGEALVLEASPVTGFFDSSKNAFCIELSEKTGTKRYLACDNATPKDVMERLFELGKKNGACHLECEMAGNDGEYSLVVVKSVKD